MTTRHLFISGLVQGVNYRWWIEQQATALGLKGWVRNLVDGRVEVVLAGAADKVAEMIKLCWQGPRGARVEKVEIGLIGPIRQIGEEFDIRY